MLDGRVVGTWKRTLGKTSVSLTLSLFTPLDKTQIQSVRAAAQRYGRFLGLDLGLEVA